MTLTDREYRYWLTRNCDRSNCWIIVAKLGEMLMHEDTTILNVAGQTLPREALKLEHDLLEYVYFAYCSKNMVCTLVQDKQGVYYLIQNQAYEQGAKDDEGNPLVGYRSVIHFGDKVEPVLKMLSGQKRKAIGIKFSDKAKLSNLDREALKGVTYIDFICKGAEEQRELFLKYQAQVESRLDLSGFFLLEPSVIQPGDSFPHTEIVLHQNNRFYQFGWLAAFPNVKTVSIWYINMLTDEGVTEISTIAPGLETLELHGCPQVTGRSLLPLAKMKALEKLVISNKQTLLQETAHETIIKDSEWREIDNTGVKVLILDSYNLTLDFIDYICKSFHSLEHFILAEAILEKLRRGSGSGYLDEKIVFHSSTDLQNVVERRRDVKVYDLVRNKSGHNFSESMLRIIAQTDEQRRSAAEELTKTAKF